MSLADANVVGVSDAQSRLLDLLERVAGGEQITITRNGWPVARLVPVPADSSVERRREAVQAMRELANRNRLEGLRVKDLIAEGRT